MRIPLFILTILLLASVVTALPYFETDHDHFYLFDPDTTTLYQYGFDMDIKNTINVSANDGVVSYLPDGGALILTDASHSQLRYDPDGTPSVLAFGENALSCTEQACSRDRTINRVRYYYSPTGIGQIYSYAGIPDDGISDTFPQITSYGDTIGSGVTGMNRAGFYGYSRMGQNATFMMAMTASTTGFGFLTDEMSRTCYKTQSGTNKRATMETLPSLSVTTPDRIYISSQDNQIRAYNFDVWRECDGTPLPPHLWTRDLPTGTQLRGEGLHVWNANNNRLVAYGRSQGEEYYRSWMGVYTRDNNLVLEFTQSRGNDSQFIDAIELPNGNLILLERVAGDVGRLVMVPVTGEVITTTLEYAPTAFERLAYDDPLTHYRHSRQLGMLPFSVYPKDVYDFSLDPTFNDIPEWLEYTYIDEFDREVHVTISDVVLDNFPVEMLVAHPSGMVHPRFSSIALNREMIRAHNTSLIISTGTETILNATGTATGEDYDLFEFVFEVSLERTANQNDINVVVDFIRSYDDTISDLLSFERWYTSPPDSTFSSMVRSYYSDDLLTNDTDDMRRLLSESHDGGTIQTITNRLFVDIGLVPHRAQLRTEVSRDGAPDTVTSSIWFPFVGFFPTDNDTTTIDSIRFHVPEDDISSQLSYRAYGHAKAPLWTTGFSSDHPHASNARESQAFILEEGENTIRTYHTSNAHSTVRNSVVNYEDWTYIVTLDNAVLLGIDDTPFTPTLPDPDESEVGGGDWLQPFAGFTLAQSTFIYTVLVIILTFVIIMGYSIYVSNLTGQSYIMTLGAVVASLASILWIFVAVFIGWLPVWVIVLLIVLGAGIATVIFRRTFVM